MDFKNKLIEQKEFNAILSSIADGVILTDLEGRVVHLSQSAENMLMIEADEVLGKCISISTLLGKESQSEKGLAFCWEEKNCNEKICPVHSKDNPRCWTVSNTCPNGVTQGTFREKIKHCQTCEIFKRNSKILEEPAVTMVSELVIDGPHKKILQIKTNPVVDERGNFLGFVRTLHDITFQREINTMKDEFVSTVSHDFRIPLTSIKGYVDLILDGEAGKFNDMQKEFLTIVKQNSDRLISMINDFLDISRIESGKMNFDIKPENIKSMIHDVVSTFQRFINEKKMEIEIKVPDKLPNILADHDRIIQVLNNLVSNSIKYTPPNGKVVVEVCEKGNYIVVSISDTGVGISTKDQEKLFTKFYRVDSSLIQETGGSGLGLSICKTIIERHGGKIWVESKEEKGSKFSFSLPALKVEVKPELIKQGMRILVVDDEPDISKLIQLYLEKEGYYVIKAFDGEEAVKMARKEHPDLITLDIMMGKISGFDVLKELKEDAHTASIPVIVLSVILDEKKGYRLGASDYLPKSVDRKKLIESVNRLVGRTNQPQNEKMVLVVDDDKDISSFIEFNLKKAGFKVIKAFNGVKALDILKKEKPDLMLLDLRMPEMDGYEVMERIKNNKKLSKIPVIIMTAYDLDREKTEILNLAIDKISKPFSMRMLTSKIKETLKK
ncbi:response regulator [Candidatus Oleimmundimicrobium sp.]|uniref:response regulator n=1 Tax=Candidatus Oleimmundimicrobium sp. TaxID=3060597 RepID=UPI00272263D3|nr:response regulator [Candidatus Oleimmundimicrobium sp.]MDO8885391.1 response regulator [Candidatus Oleimmundimicrobium sp.]